MKIEERYNDKNQFNLRCYRNRKKLEIRLEFGNVLYFQILNLLVIWKLEITGFTHRTIHQKNKKQMIYTPIGGSPTINIIVYLHLGSLTRLNF